MAKPPRARRWSRCCRSQEAASIIPPLPADLDAGLRRLKLAAIRRLAPEPLVVAKTQRWKPEEFLRTLIDAELTLHLPRTTSAQVKQHARTR